MKVYIEEKEFTYENKVENIDLLIEDIYKVLKEESKILEYMEIDGVKQYIDFGEYIFSNINNIKEIKIVSVTVSELIENSLMTTLDYIESALPILEKLKNNIDFTILTDLIEGLTWIFETFLYIDKDPNLNSKIENKENWNIYAQSVYELGNILPELLEVIEKQNNSLFSNLMERIINIFNEMEKSIIEIIRID